MEFHRDNQWWTSPYNLAPEVQSQIHIAQKVEIQDTTLRDGEQTPGIVLSVDEKVEIARMLSDVGVERIEAGMVAVSEQDREAIRRVAAMPNAFRMVNCLVRATHADIDIAEDCGVDGVVVEMPVGYPKLLHQYHWTIEQALEKSLDAIEYAKGKGLYVSMSPFDTTRAREEDMEYYFDGLMKHAAPDSITILDTMGCALPQTIGHMVRLFKKLGNGISVEVHTHNDFGMGLANEIMAICAGADVVHSCVLGLGDRTGNVALEELIVAMKILLGVDNDYRLEKLPALCETVAKATGRFPPPNKPVVGAYNYTREAGMGVDLVMKNPLVMFATNPALFGRTGHIVLGKKSGRLSVEYYLEKHGLHATHEQVMQMVDEVKQRGIQKKAPLTDEEFLEIAHRCL